MFRHPDTREKRIVNAVFDELYGRNGFAYWWAGIDRETQQQIQRALLRVVERELTGAGA